MAAPYTRLMQAGGVSIAKAPEEPKERRAAKRYRVRLGVRWRRLRGRRVVDSGTAETLDASSKGLLLKADRGIPVGTCLNLSIAWPVWTADSVYIEFLVRGRVVRTAGCYWGIRMLRHEFQRIGGRERSIMNQTGHRSLQMVRRYIREGSLFRENSAGKLGL